MRNSFKIAIAFVVVALCLAYLFPVQAEQYLMSAQIFNRIFDPDTDSVNITIKTEEVTGDYTVGGDFTLSGAADIGGDITLENDEIIDNGTNGTVQVQSATALTNTVSPEFSLLHETSGVPANGIGTGISFVQETSAGNNETGMSLDAVVTDATGASEDFKFSVQLMAAGAAKSEVFAVSSTGAVTASGGGDFGGDITLENDEIIDNGTNGTVQVQSATALTNAVSPELSLLHETSGVPANGIGTGISFVQETSAGNNETGMSLDAVVSDATGASEDFKFSVQLMAAGAAKAEKFAIESTGVVTLVNAATIDNSVNGTVTITEPTISLQGAIDHKVCTMTKDDATPSVAGCYIMETVANDGALEITDLDDPVVGSIVILVGTSATNSPTITDGGNFALSGGWTGSVDETLTLYVQADNDYIELTRSTN